MVIVVDFDYTLFNTHLFVNAFKDVFFKHKIDESDWKETYDAAMRWDGGEMGYDYSFEKHVDALIEKGYKLEKDTLVKELYDCISKDFLYDDVDSFLEDIKQHFSERLLITAGNHHFQQTKVERVGVHEYFTDIVYINGDKHIYVNKVYRDDDKVIFINDNLKENKALKELMPHAHIITKFNTRRNTEEEMRESGLPYFETLTAIKEYVTNELI